ncbi:hypothetical protein [Streptomyces bikiniensis]|uniref:hypothetical protein n=1 Tax=Streptomyces bikiniensis TaxID=1896 RepID=UPI0004C240A1|nr:hypothetical protein [Streptomyces bikiniensis]
MPNELDSTSIHTRYTERLTDDLEANRAEQASMAARLEQLRTEEKWLITMLDSMPPSAPAGSVVAGSDEAVREAAALRPRGTREAARGRKATAGKTPPAKKAPTKKAPAAKKAAAKRAKAPARRTTPEKATPKKAAGGTSGAQPTPTLGALIDSLLADRFLGEPLKVSEVHAELAAAHAERSTSVQVVRNALEGLVKKNRIEKDTRQGVALYTKPRTADTAGAGASLPAGEPAEAVAAGA